MRESEAGILVHRRLPKSNRLLGHNVSGRDNSLGQKRAERS
jgi:hypothetical protein